MQKVSESSSTFNDDLKQLVKCEASAMSVVSSKEKLLALITYDLASSEVEMVDVKNLIGSNKRKTGLKKFSRLF